MREVTVTPAPGESVLALLSKNAKVKTAYGGGFVNSIDGLASSYTGLGVKQDDWFYVVNGVQPSRGAGEYTLQPGDSVWWDYHSWEFAVAIPAVVGQYPHPFVSPGEDAPGADASDRLPTDVFAANDALTQTEGLASVLRAAGADVRRAGLEPGTPRPSGRHTIAVGRMSDILAVPWVKEAFAEPARSGVFATTGRADRLVLLDTRGGKHEVPAGTGAVLATGGGTPGTALWIVTATGEVGVARAAQLIVERPLDLAGHFGVAIDATGTVIPLPVEPGWVPGGSNATSTSDGGSQP
jgi:hypothetical protein